MPKERILCSATRTDGSGPCRNSALPGLTVCKFHGGAAPKARAITQAVQARTELARFGVPIETTAVAAFQEALSRAVGMVRWWEQRLQLIPAPLTGLVTKVEDWAKHDFADQPGPGPSLLLEERTEKYTEDGVETKIELKTNPLFAEYRAERDHLVKIATTGIRLGLTQMQVEAFLEAAQQHVEEAARLLTDVLNDPELGEHAELVRTVIARHIQARIGPAQQLATRP